MTREELDSRMAVLLGGRAAEWIVFSHLSTGGADDLAKVTDIARDVVMRFGMEKTHGPVSYESPRSPFMNGAPSPESWHERRFSDETARVIDQAEQHVVETTFDRTANILKAHRVFWNAAPNCFWKKRRSTRPILANSATRFARRYRTPPLL
jgi:cell division protease FtsH